MSWVRVAGVLGAVSVAAGALGAHALAERVEPSQLEAWRTATQYALVHSLALLALGLYEAATQRSVHLPASLFGAGILLFSGSIYLLVLTGWRLIGPVTPFGGLALIAGWVSLLTLVRS